MSFGGLQIPSSLTISLGLVGTTVQQHLDGHRVATASVVNNLESAPVDHREDWASNFSVPIGFWMLLACQTRYAEHNWHNSLTLSYQPFLPH